jgi:uncharacterized repeat protein (TIGR03803 family)
MQRKWYRNLRPRLIVAVVLTATMISAHGVKAATTYKSLHKFTGQDGAVPISGLIFDEAGNLYGTTYVGGASSLGTAFELTLNTNGTWTEKLLYSFCSLKNCGDGENPLGALIFDQSGNLYGTAYDGGAYGYGAVFQLSPNVDGTWTESVLHSFSGPDGALPTGGLTFDGSGNLYGATIDGGAFNWGAVFELTPNVDGTWTESILHSFSDGTDGGAPLAGLIFDQAGDIYSTTVQGGTYGEGVVFELTPTSDGSWTEKVLHGFTGGKDGCFPATGLIFDRSGNLYGTTECGGFVSFFRLMPNSKGGWKEKVLFLIKASKDGSIPAGSLIFDQSGNLYGMTREGGSSNCVGGTNGCGVVFEIAPTSNGAWKETVLHRFADHPGSFPLDALTFDKAGNLYGTTEGDGSNTFGSVFEITPQ